jgi:hypothetical protein
MRRATLLAPALLACFTAAASADYVTVDHHAYIYAQPESHSHRLGEANIDDSFALLSGDQSPTGFYSIRTADGTPGWIHRNSVRRWPGDIPDSNPAAPVSAAPSSHALPSSLTFTTGAFHTADKGDCPPAGLSGDAHLNQLKNRDVPPPSGAPVDSSVSTFIEKVIPEIQAMKEHTRDQWPAATRALAAAVEDQPVRVEGYLLAMQVEGEEACNCGSTVNVDHHLWLCGEPGDKTDRAEAMVVEISPRLLPIHPHWTDDRLRQLVHDQTKVRISGWILYDQEHTEQVGKTRGTLWEIHPIHVIEEFRDNAWHSLDE